MGKPEKSQNSGRGRPSKVVQLLEKYELPGLGAELERLWTTEENRQSLRELAAYFNQQLIRQTLMDENVGLVEGEVENLYRLLTAEDVSQADAMRARRRLESEEIDVDALESDFVTYQAIRTYLQNYRGAEYTPDDTAPLKREKQNLQQLRGRITAVTEGKLEQLQKDEELKIDNYQTLIAIQVVCESCNTQHDIFELLDRGGCDCQLS